MDSDRGIWFIFGLFCDAGVGNTFGDVIGLVLLSDCTLDMSSGADDWGGLSGCWGGYIKLCKDAAVGETLTPDRLGALSSKILCLFALWVLRKYLLQNSRLHIEQYASIWKIRFPTFFCGLRGADDPD